MCLAYTQQLTSRTAYKIGGSSPAGKWAHSRNRHFTEPLCGMHAQVCGRAVHAGVVHSGGRLQQELHPHQAPGIRAAGRAARAAQQAGRQRGRLHPLPGAQKLPASAGFEGFLGCFRRCLYAKCVWCWISEMTEEYLPRHSGELMTCKMSVPLDAFCLNNEASFGARISSMSCISLFT